MKIKVFDTANVKQQDFLHYYDWELISHPKFPIPPIAFYHPIQAKHYVDYLKTIMNPDKYNISFFGSGDFHYLTLPILELKKNPYYLIMFDNHWDLGNRGLPTNWLTKKLKILSADDEIKYDCASWLYPAATSPLCKGVLHLGQTQKILFSSRLINRISGVPKLVRDHNFKHFKKNFDNIDVILNDIPKDTDIYITIDKDVLSRKILQTDYSQGCMTDKTMFELLEKIKNKCGNMVVGVDVCGEPSVGYFRKWSQPEDMYNPNYIKAIKPHLERHSKINDRICEIFYKN